MAKKKNFKFPEQLLRQVDECSHGGFVLFNFNAEGQPEVHLKFDNTINAMAIQYYIDNWTRAIETINLDATIESISKENVEEIDPDDGDEE